MKIIMSPSKTQDFSNSYGLYKTKHEFRDETDFLVNKIQSLTKEELAGIMNIKGKLLDDTAENYKKSSEAIDHPAIASYTGAVFKGLELSQYGKDEIAYMVRHLRILSALYGCLRPTDAIKPYRLDMKMNVIERSLYSYWTEQITDHFIDEDLIINIASNEFSKLVKLPMITLNFKENRNGTFKVVGAYAKKARGYMINYLIKNQIDDLDAIKQFNEDGYSFNPEQSSETELIFTR